MASNVDGFEPVDVTAGEHPIPGLFSQGGFTTLEAIRSILSNVRGLCCQTQAAVHFASARLLLVRDHSKPPLTERQLERVWEAFLRLEKPVLIHCSAGIDRTGMAIAYVKRRLDNRRHE